MDDSHVKVPIMTESCFYENALLDSFNTAGGTNSFMKLHHCMAYQIGGGTSKFTPKYLSRDFSNACNKKIKCQIYTHQSPLHQS
jgi:hypothetical protein